MYNITQEKAAETVKDSDGVPFDIAILDGARLTFVSHRSPEMETDIFNSKMYALAEYNRTVQQENSVFDPERLPIKYRRMWKEKVALASITSGITGSIWHTENSEDGESKNVEIHFSGKSGDEIRKIFSLFSPLPADLVEELYAAGSLVDAITTESILEKKSAGTGFTVQSLRDMLGSQVAKVARLLSGQNKLETIGRKDARSKKKRESD